MGLLINPDGTTTYIEEEVDESGALRPRKSYELYHEETIESVVSGVKEGPSRKNYIYNAPKKKPKKKTPIHRTESQTTPKFSHDPSIGRVVDCRDNLTYSGYVNLGSELAIDVYFRNKKANRQVVPDMMLDVVSDKLGKKLFKYFRQRFYEYKNYCQQIGLIASANKTKQEPQKSVKKKKKKQQQVWNETKVPSRNEAKGSTKPTSGHSIGEIAKVVKSKDSINDSSEELTSLGFGKGRRAKYGYARDYFGRVLERDILDEDRRNEFAQQQKQQSRYDYSSYDENDDHDGAYSSWE